jgi:fibronectin-binding autotransporter adhesin
VDISSATLNLGSAGGTIDTNSNNVTLANPIGNNGVGSFTKVGAGILTLTAANTYSGGTNINGGTLDFSALNNFGTSANITLGGGTLQYAVGNALDISTDTVTLASGTDTIDTNGNNVTFLNTIGNGGTGGLAKTGLGILTLDALNTYTGATSVNLGTLLLNLSTVNTGVINSASTLTLGSGTLDVLGASSGSSSQTLGNPTLTGNTGGTILVNANGGSGTTLTLGNSWTRSTGSTVNINVASSGSNVTASPSLTNSILGYATLTNATTTSFVTVSSGNLAPYSSASTLISTSNSSSTNFLLTSSLTMNTSNHTLNSLQLASASGTSTLSLGNTSRITTITSLGVLMTGANSFIVSTGQLGGNNSELIVHQMGTGTLTISANVSSGTGHLTKDGSGNLSLTATNAYSGGTVINAGTVTLGAANAAGTGAIIVNNGFLALGVAGTYGFGALTLTNGTLQYASGVTTDISTHTLNLNIGGGTIDTGANNVSFANAIGNNGVGGLTKIGAGTLTLSGNDTYTGLTNETVGMLILAGNNTAATGGVTLSAGNLDINNVTALGTGAFTIVGGNLDDTSASALTLSTNNAQYWYGDFNFVGTKGLNLGAGAVTLNATRTVTVTGNTLTVGGNIGDAGHAYGLTKVGAGTLALSGNDSYTGLTTVNAGTLILAGNDTADTGGVTLSAGNLDINNATALGTGTFTITSGNFDNTSGAALTLTTNNVQAWNGDFTFVGSSGLNLGIGAVVINATRTVTVSGNTLTVGGNISDGGNAYGLTKVGAGSLVLAGNNTYTGQTTINAGTLIFSGNTTILGGGITVNSSLVFSQALASSFAQVIGGSGTLTKSGAGNLTLTGINTYTGATNITNGILTVDGATNGAINQPTSNLTVGVSSTDNGTLQIQNGGNVSEDFGFLGYGLNSVGNALITGTNSLFNIYGALDLGENGAGNIYVSNGGKVFEYTNNPTYLMSIEGDEAGSAGSATITDPGSVMDVQGSMSVGNFGSGNLSVVNGGLLSVGGSVLLASGSGSSGSLNLTSGGTLQIGGVNGIAAGSGSSSFNLDGGIIQVSGSDLTTSVPATLGAATTSTINTNSFNATFSGGLGGSGTLAKVGAGILSLAGSNNYSGPTEVESGELEITGSTASGSVVTVSSGAILAGNGTINGNVLLNTGAMLIPGHNGLGALSIANLTWNGSTDGSATLKFALGNANNSSTLINVIGALTKGGGTDFTIDFEDTGYFDGVNIGNPNTYTLVDFGTNNGFNVSDFGYTNLGPGLRGSFILGANDLQFAVIPEPAAWSLLAGFGGLLLALRRRKRETVTQ